MAVAMDTQAVNAAIASATWQSTPTAPFNTAVVIPDSWKSAFWKWYDAHAHDVILKKGFLVFKITVEVKDIEFIFILLFGAHP